ncbi:MAG: hypothetical protein KKD44_12425 [Proteobacteria bacterium]|nr:hypothetical protein [Pseudomonadota bacterium]
MRETSVFLIFSPGKRFHGMGHERSRKYNMTHGATMALLTLLRSDRII